MLTLILAAHSCAFGSGENNGRGAKAIAMGNAFVAVADNPWAVSYNPAGLSLIPSVQASVFFVPRQFELAELKTASLAVAAPIGILTLGGSVEQFGFDLYRETNLTLAGGRVVGAGISAGIAVNLHRISIARYGTAERMTLDLGLLAQTLDDLRFGFAFKNITATTLGQMGERLPQVLTLGTCYAPWGGFLLTAEMEKDSRHPFVVKGGIEQQFFDVLALRIGVSNNPDKFSAGIGARYAFAEFLYAGYHHSQLGWTHQIEIALELGN